MPASCRSIHAPAVSLWLAPNKRSMLSTDPPAVRMHVQGHNKAARRQRGGSQPATTQNILCAAVLVWIVRGVTDGFCVQEPPATSRAAAVAVTGRGAAVVKPAGSPVPRGLLVVWLVTVCVAAPAVSYSTINTPLTMSTHYWSSSLCCHKCCSSYKHSCCWLYVCSVS